MKKIKIWGTGLAMFASLCLSFSHAQAAYYDPHTNWQTLDSPHFQIHYPESLASLTQKAANYFEDAHTHLSADMSWAPHAKTQVVLVDNTDDANGFASVLPYNWIVIFAVPPRAGSSLANYDDWLKVVINHEYTHVLHFDRAKGFWAPFRLLLGHTVAPAGVVPVWMKEGFATYQETRLTNGGRGDASYTQMVLRAASLEKNFPHLDEVNGFSWEWPSYRAAYLFGVEFLEYLAATYGHDKLQIFNDRTQRSPMLFAVNRQAKKAFGKTYYQLWREWQGKLSAQYDAQVAALGDLTPLSELRKKTPDEVLSVPTLSPDGKQLAFVLESPHGFSQIRTLELESKKETILLKKQGAIALSWLPDGSGLVYAAPVRYKRYSLYNDLWKYDFASKKVKRLTFGERARDPSVSADGKYVLYVAAQTGFDELRVMPLLDEAQLKQNVNKKDVTTFEPLGSSWKMAAGEENVAAEEDLPKPQLKKAQKLTQLPRLILQLADADITQFSRPRWSPDGKSVIVTGHSAASGWKLYQLQLRGKNAERALARFQELTAAKMSKRVIFTDMPATRVTANAGNELDASWLDAENVLFSSDGSGIANIYSAHLKTKKVTQVSNVTTGLFHPVSDGKNIFAQHYHSRGFDLVEFSLGGAEQNSNAEPLGRWRAARGRPLGLLGRPQTSRQTGPIADVSLENVENIPLLPSEPVTFPTKKYSSLGRSLIVPQFIMPGAFYTGDTTIVNLITGGADPLYRHSWRAGGSYRFDAARFGYFASYMYNRYRPTFLLGFNDSVVNFGQLNFIQSDGSIHSVHYFEERRGGSATVAYPLGRSSVAASYFYEDRFPGIDGLSRAEQNALNTGIFSGARLMYSFGKSEVFPASISRNEDGRQVRLLGSITDAKFGSGEDNEQKIFAGDWREFIRISRHQVLALRAAGGMTWGDRLLQGTFGMGGALGEGTLAGGGSLFYFPLRGLPTSFLSRTRAMLLSSEYRFPLLTVQRGLGTLPFYAKNIHAAFFADYGDAWNENQKDGGFEQFFDDFFLSTGAELQGDFMIGNGLPLTGRLGYGIVVLNRDRLGNFTDELFGNSLKNGVVILQLGTSF